MKLTKPTPRAGDDHLLAQILAFLGTLAWAAAAAAVCEFPVEQWTWDGNLEQPTRPGVCMTPLVVQLTDDNLDGRIDSRDVPDVVFMHVQPNAPYLSWISAVDGATGTPHFTISSHGLAQTALAAGDIDGDGFVELVAIDGAHKQRIVAFEHTGHLKWESGPTSRLLTAFDTIGIANLDFAGTPEIYVGEVVFNADGSLRFEGTAGRGGFERTSQAVDLLPANPGLELLAGNTLYDSDGRILWTDPTLPDGLTAVGDFDGDGNPEIVLAASSGSFGKVYLLDHLGIPLFPAYTGMPWSHAQPAVADIDGDGDPEVIVNDGATIRALEWSPAGFTQKWSNPMRDVSTTSASVYDLDGDGAYEVIYEDEVEWSIYDGVTGAAISKIPFASATLSELPVIADIDNDCLPEILIVGCDSVSQRGRNAVTAYECPDAVAARSIWNQYSYHVTNVNDDGAIPRVEATPWTGENTWKGQVSGGGSANAGRAQSICLGASATLDCSATAVCGTGLRECRWLVGATEVCPWSTTPTCDVAPTATTTYTLETRCPSGCPRSDTVQVTVTPDVVPDDLGNTLRAIRDGLILRLSWATTPAAVSYRLYRGTDKRAWPATPHRSGIAGNTEELADVPAPPVLYFYRAVGESCSGVEGK